MSIFEVLDRIKPQLPEREQARAVAQPQLETARRALVVDTPERTVITVPVETLERESSKLDAESFLTRISGRLVGAEVANRNKQFWSTADLEFGLPSVAGGPLNWLHDERHIVGALTSALLVKPVAEAAAGQLVEPPHINADSVMWSYIFPAETRIVEQAAVSKNLYYSMECRSKKVQCVGEKGCGQEMDFLDALQRTERACAHQRDRAAARRFVNPIFQGAAVIVPPVKPGWKDANADLVRRAAANENLQEFADGDEALAAQILAFIKPQT